jgi:hypothetical protein
MTSPAVCAALARAYGIMPETPIACHPVAVALARLNAIAGVPDA